MSHQLGGHHSGVVDSFIDEGHMLYGSMVSAWELNMETDYAPTTRPNHARWIGVGGDNKLNP